MDWPASYITIAVIVFILIPFMIKIVHGKQAMVVEFLGRPLSQARMSGLHLILPWPFMYEVGRISFQQHEITIQMNVNTKDNAFVKLPVAVQYAALEEAHMAVKAHYELANAQEQIRSYLENTIRRAVTGLTFAQLRESRDEIESEVFKELQTKFSTFGYEIRGVLVDQPIPTEEVQRSFNRVIAAAQEAVAATKEAEALKIKLVGEAAAEAESKKLQGEGIARMRDEIAKGIAHSVETIRSAMPGLSDSDIISFLTATNRLDTFSHAASHGNMLIVDLGESDMEKKDKMQAAFTALYSQKEEHPFEKMKGPWGEKK